MYLSASNISSIESLTGSTKHAESWFTGVPAFISVGELGKNSKLDIAWKNSFSAFAVGTSSYKTSTPAIALETLLKSPTGLSVIVPFESLVKYLFQVFFEHLQKSSNYLQN